MLKALKTAWNRTVEAAKRLVSRVLIRTVIVRQIVFVPRPAALRIPRPRCSPEQAAAFGQESFTF